MPIKPAGQKVTKPFNDVKNAKYAKHTNDTLVGDRNPQRQCAIPAARAKVIPFTVTIPPEERDKDLDTQLRTALEGLLAVCGCLA